MIDTRAVGQELQDQLRAAARKGQQRVTTTARTLSATARMIRPQLPSLPRPDATRLRSVLPTPEQIRSAMPTPEQIRSVLPTPEQIRSALPTPAQIRSAIAAPAQLIEQAPKLAAKLPGGDRLTAGAQELAGQLRAAQRMVVSQVRDAAAPLRKHAGPQPTRGVTHAAAHDSSADQAATGDGVAAEHAHRRAAAPARPARPAAAAHAKANGKAKPKPKPRPKAS